MDTQLLVVMVVTPLTTLAVVGLGQVLNHRSGKARADEIKVDLTAQTNAIKADLTAAIRDTKVDLIANMSQLRNDLTTAILKTEASANNAETRAKEDLKEWFRSELRASMAELRASIIESSPRAMRAGSSHEPNDPS